MAFTSKDDINILQPSDSQTVGAGAGNDRYVLDGSVIGAGQSITISDADGLNTLQLTGGLEIASSLIDNNALQLTLSNGARVSVLGATSFQFQTGGSPISGTGGITQGFADFAVQSLGAPGVPAQGEAPVAGDTNITVIEQGGTTSGGAGGGGGDGPVDPGAGGDPGTGGGGGGDDGGDGTVDPGAGGDPGTGGGGGSPVDGAVLLLTQGTDNLVGTAQDDVFDGVVNASGGINTLTGDDSVIGGSGADLLRLAQDIMDDDLAGVFGIERIETVSETIVLGMNAARVDDNDRTILSQVINASEVDSTVTLGFVPNGLSLELGAGTLDTVVLGKALPAVIDVAVNGATVGDGSSMTGDDRVALSAGTALDLSITDEGVLLGGGPDTAIVFNVNDLGKFSQVVLGTAEGDVFNATEGPLSDAFGAPTNGVALFGGLGNDTLTGSTLADTLMGGAGNDTLTGGAGTDTVDGGAGNDQVRVNGTDDNGAESLDGGADTDTLLALAPTDLTAAAAVKNFEVVALDEAANLQLAAGALLTNPGLTQVVGTAGGAMETLTFVGDDGMDDGIDLSQFTKATDAGLVAMGLAGNDTLTGSILADTLMGGAGDDTLTGGVGNDTVNGDGGNDIITVSQANDSGAGEVLDGGVGRDTLNVLAGDLMVDPGATVKNFEMVDLADTAGVTLSLTQFNANPMLDTLNDIGNNGKASFTVLGDDSATTLDLSSITMGNLTATNASNPQIIADATNGTVNTLIGSPFSDLLLGGDNGNTILGGAGNDFIMAGTAGDTIAGGIGADDIELGAGSDLVSVDGITSDDDRSDAFGFMQDDRVALTNITGTMGSELPVQFASVEDVTSNGFNFTNQIIADNSVNLGSTFGNDDQESSSNLVAALREDFSAVFPNGLYIYITDEARLYFAEDADLSDTATLDIQRVGGFFEDTKDVVDMVGFAASTRAVLIEDNFVFGAPTDLFGL